MLKYLWLSPGAQQQNGDVRLGDSETLAKWNYKRTSRTLPVDAGINKDQMGPGQAICRQLQFYDVHGAGTVIFFATL